MLLEEKRRRKSEDEKDARALKLKKAGSKAGLGEKPVYKTYSKGHPTERY